MKSLKRLVIAPLILALAGTGAVMLGGCEENWEQNPGLEPAEPYQTPTPAPPVEPIEPMTEPEPEPEPMMPPLHEEPVSEAEPESDPAQDESATEDWEAEPAE